MSSDKSDDEEHDAISKQIVDYYRKYSQSKHLPKYFSGTSLSYMPPIVREEEIHPNIPIIAVDYASSETLVAPEKDTDYPKVVSPTSSITSNRKLEWDNGADIGYDNYQKSTKLQKSTSLPILLVDQDVGSTDKGPKLAPQIVTIISYPSSDDVHEKTQSSSSSTSYRARAPIASSSSSVQTEKVASASTNSSLQTPQNTSSSSSSLKSTIDYLKSRIGVPDAESTPKIEVDKPQKRVVTLCSTKPINIECVARKKSSDKVVQTSLSQENVSKSVQTSLEVLPEKLHSEPVKPENQSVIIISYESENDKQISSSNTQTESEVVASHCDSFEYYKNEKGFKKSSTDSSKDLPILGQLISKKQSKNLIGDIDKSIDILQKLLKSKKYDAATKKRYIKKIVEKIVDSKYNEDSTTSSELFVPKASTDQWQPKLTLKTFSDEFLPKKSIFVVSKPGDSAESSLEKHPSWKEDKTASERRLEKQKGQGDHLLKFAKKERQHQLSWINDEITHLTKLKGLLEQKVQRTTTVYMVSKPEYSSASSSRSSTSRNYVIETELSKSGSSGVPTDYNIRDKDGERKYQVTTSEEDVNPNVIGEVEVVSDDATTNIKIRTVKNDQNQGFKPPGLVGTGKYDTFPRSKGEREMCWPCGTKKKNEGFSFKVPLLSDSSLYDQVNAVLDKHGGRFCHCKKHANTERPGNSKETRTSVLTVVDPTRECYCCGHKRSKRKEAPACKCRGDCYKFLSKIQDFDAPKIRSCRCKNGHADTSTKNDKKNGNGSKDNYQPEEQLRSLQTGVTESEEHLRLLQAGFTEPEEHLRSLQTGFTEPEEHLRSLQAGFTEPEEHLRSLQPGFTEPEEHLRSLQTGFAKPEEHLRSLQTESTEPEEGLKSLQTESTEPGKGDVVTGPINGTISQRKDINDSDKTSKPEDAETYLTDKSQSDEFETDSIKYSESNAEHKSNSGGSKTSKLSDQANNLAENTVVTKRSSSSQDSKKSAKQYASAEIQTCKCDFENAQNPSTKIKPGCCYCKPGDKQFASAEVQTSFSEKSVSTGSQSSSYTSSFSSTITSSESLTSCVCCKRQNVTSRHLYRLREKLSDQTYPLCQYCYRQNRSLYSPGFYKPDHVCNCYSVVQTKTLNEIKQTINDLNELQEFCTCKSGSRSSSQYCEYCKCKLKKTSRNRNGIAYMLTFENEPIQEGKKEKKRKKPLEEIKIKIPVVAKKRHKDKENNKKREKRRRESESSTTELPRNKTSLQEYLAQNRPEFVEEAEGRRRSVNQNRTQREEMSDYNKLNFLKKSQEENKKNSKRIFSGKEMKEINKRNYNKLPEVQQKLIDNREKQLRRASRLMADTFNQKLRENVLRGKKDLPTNCKVICM